MAKRKIVDAHHHLWDLGRAYNYPWLQDKPSGEGMLGDLLAHHLRLTLMDDYLADSSDYEVVKSVHVEAVPRRSARGNDAGLRASADQSRTVWSPSPRSDAPDAERVIAAQAGSASVKGIPPDRQLASQPTVVDLHRARFARRRQVAGELQAAQEIWLSFDMQLYAVQMASAAAWRAESRYADDRQPRGYADRPRC